MRGRLHYCSPGWPWWASSAPAHRQFLARSTGHFDDVFTSDVYDCDGTPAQDAVDVASTSYSTSAAPPRSPTTGTACTARDHQPRHRRHLHQRLRLQQQGPLITDNGDGTITITVFAAGGSRFYDQFGNFVLKDPGSVRFAFDVDYHGTPATPRRQRGPDSFRIVRPSTGNSDFSDRDFCADLVEFTS